MYVKIVNEKLMSASFAFAVSFSVPNSSDPAASILLSDYLAHHFPTHKNYHLTHYDQTRLCKAQGTKAKILSSSEYSRISRLIISNVCFRTTSLSTKKYHTASSFCALYKLLSFPHTSHEV